MEEDLELKRLIEERARKIFKNLSSYNVTGNKRKYRGGIVYNLDYTNFDEFLKEFEIAVVDFWAEWCPPCFILAPIIEELASEYTNIGFGKVNFDENREIAMKYDIMNLPTIIIFKNSRPFDLIVGAVPREYIEAKILKAKRLN
ncbi:MAG: thioredoxin [Sulfolobaceae archaeon]